MIGPELVTLATTGAGALVAAAGAWQARRKALGDADRLAGLVAAHPCRGLPPGSGRIVEGEVLAGLAPEVPVTPSRLVAVEAPEAPARLAPVEAPVTVRGPGPACHGTLTRHRDGTTSCHNGRPDCLGAESGHTHRRVISCADLSHGCGVCDVTGGVL